MSEEKFDKKKYDLEYMQERRKKNKVKTLNTVFNLENEEELKLYNYVKAQKNMTIYIKSLIENDMKA